MQDLTKIKVAKILFSSRFWVATFVYYLTTRGIPSGEVFYLMGIFYVASFLFEYPTGVIGDYYSHRISVYLGYLILALSYFVLSYPGSFVFYALVLLLLALGQALISGSDVALLYGLSDDFRKDLSQVKFYGFLSSFAGISIGGIVSAYDLRYPLYLTSIFLIAAAFFTFWIANYKQSRLSGNIFTAGKEGIRYSLENKSLMHLMLLASLCGGLFFSFKWLYNPLFLELKFDVALWGILAGIGMLLIAFGTKFYQKFLFMNNLASFFLLIFAMILFGYTSIPALAMAGFTLSHIIRGYFETKLAVEITHAVSEKIRASVLSLKGLLIKVTATVIMGAGGLILEKFSFSYLLYFIAVALLIFGTFSAVKTAKKAAV